MVTSRHLLLAGVAVALLGCEDPWAVEDLDALDAPVVFAELSVGGQRTCGLDADRRAWCWGVEAGTDSPRLLCSEQPSFGYAPPPVACWDRPVPVAGNHRFPVIDVSEGYAFAIDDSGVLWGWGGNANFLLTEDDPRTAEYNQPIKVTIVEDMRFEAIGVGNNTACGITTAGAIWCWGQPNMMTTGTPTPPCSAGFPYCGAPPRQVGSAMDWVEVDVGYYHACARNSAGLVSCWGMGPRGELGSTTTAMCLDYVGISVRCAATPTPVSGAVAFTSLSSSGQQVCAINGTNTLYCWGAQSTSTTYQTPTALGAGYLDVSVHDRFGNCVLRTNGSVSCTGIFGAGVTAITLPGPMVGVGASGTHGCAWNAAGSAWCFGDKTFGQLGDGVASWAYTATAYQVSAPYRD